MHGPCADHIRRADHATRAAGGGAAHWIRIAVRPSEALAVAVREELPIGVADAILDAVGQPIADLFPHGGDAPPDQQLRSFREFLDEVSPDDFGTPGG